MARIVRRKERPEPEPTPEPVTPTPEPVTPEPDIPSEITPAGPIKTLMPWGKAPGIQWEAITRYDNLIHAAADPVDWPIERVRGHIVIESQGNPKAVQQNNSNGWSYGLMQIVPYGVGWGGWNALVREKAGLAANSPRERVVNALYEPRINIAVGVAILEGLYQQYGTLDRASSAFFLGNPDWRGEDTVNGNTGLAYQRSINGLISEQRGHAPPPPKPRDLIAMVMGGNYVITQEFGVPSGAADYSYGIGHGLNGRQHTGIDISGYFGQPLYTPIDGIVVCAGTGVGSGAHGSSCAAFNDYMGKRAGRIEVLTGDGRASLIFGHSSTATVRVGQEVNAGDQVATLGGMNGWHVHLEARTWANGNYMIRDPRAVFTGGVVPTPYAERVPVPQPDAWDKEVQVTVTEDGVPLLQRADPEAAEVASPFKAGESFGAVALVYGEGGDDDWYWITKRATRIPIQGTTSTLLGER
jgi:murein DD-endopeptidase MepM/ murein hydrolase activator NlpD